jgi:3-hydroxyisobutyrate dehydrogenase-like beta-hydroxyacid dehydrogenase
MASNLVSAVYPLRVYDIDGSAVEALVNQGATAVSSAKEAAEGSEVVVTMLPASQHSLDAAFGVDC